jgi:hypothetical protein
MHKITLLLVASLWTASLPCQTESHAPQPLVRIEAVGPDGWRLRFGPTNLGSLLESAQGRALWEPQLLPFLDFWGHLIGDEAAAKEARARIAGYGGRIRIGIWFGDGDLEKAWRAAVVIEGDGRTDLAALAGDVQALQGRLEGEWRETEVGGQTVRCLHHRDEAMTAPLREEQHLLIVAAAGGALAETLAAGRTFAGRPDGKPPLPTTPALTASVDMPLLMARLHEQAVANNDEDEWAVVEALGLGSLGETRFTLGTAGPRLQFELSQAFTSEKRGIFGAFCPATQGLSSLMGCVPGDSEAWKAGRFDWKALYASIEAAIVASGEDLDEMRGRMRESMGVDLANDLLAHTTDELLVLGSPFRDVDRPEDWGWAFAVRLTNEAAFAQSLETALKQANPMLSREATSEHGAAKLHRYGNMLGYDLWFATGHGLFAMGGGNGAEERLGQLFDAAARVAAAAKETPTPDPAMPATFVELRRYLPPGLNGVASGEIGALTALPAELWGEFLSWILPFRLGRGAGVDSDPEEHERLRELLREHRLDVLHTATGCANGTFCWRLYW